MVGGSDPLDRPAGRGRKKVGPLSGEGAPGGRKVVRRAWRGRALRGAAVLLGVPSAGSRNYRLPAAWRAVSCDFDLTILSLTMMSDMMSCNSQNRIPLCNSGHTASLRPHLTSQPRSGMAAVRTAVAAWGGWGGGGGLAGRIAMRWRGAAEPHFAVVEATCGTTNISADDGSGG